MRKISVSLFLPEKKGGPSRASPFRALLSLSLTPPPPKTRAPPPPPKKKRPHKSPLPSPPSST